MAAVDETQPSAIAAEAPMPRFGALGYPNYRRFWFANVARVFGLQFRFIGSLWLVTQLTPSPLWLGVVSVSGAIPTILLSVPAGLLADRIDGRRLLVWSQLLTAVLTLGLGGLVVVGEANVWWVVFWSMATGALAALGNPAQNAMLPRLIEMRAIASAVAYTSAIWNAMGIVGPAAAGVLIAVIGTGQAFFVTAAGFAVSAALMQSLRIAPIAQRTRKEAGGMLDGIRYILSNQVFFATIGLSFFTSLFGMSYMVLLPAFAQQVLHTDARGYGLMAASAGVGALLGTLSIVRLNAKVPRGPLMLVAAALFGVMIAAFAASRALPLSMALLFLGGFTSSVYLNIGLTTLQIQVPDALRGRVMGVWSMTYFLAQVGGMPAVLVAQWWGAPVAVALGALSVTAFAVTLLVVSPALRQISAPPVGVPVRRGGW